MSSKPPGRPKYKPGDGYYSISEAASLLGISDGAIRQRIERGTLPSEQDVLPNKERRRVIPKEAIDELLPAQKKDTDEVALKVEKVDVNTRLIFDGLTALAHAIDHANQDDAKRREDDAKRHEELRAGQVEVLGVAKELIEVVKADTKGRQEDRAQILAIMREKRKPWWIRLFGG